jgi:hypothetical protein
VDWGLWRSGGVSMVSVTGMSDGYDAPGHKAIDTSCAQFEQC